MEVESWCPCNVSLLHRHCKDGQQSYRITRTVKNRDPRETRNTTEQTLQINKNFYWFTLRFTSTPRRGSSRKVFRDLQTKGKFRKFSEQKRITRRLLKIKDERTYGFFLLVRKVNWHDIWKNDFKKDIYFNGTSQNS